MCSYWFLKHLKCSTLCKLVAMTGFKNSTSHFGPKHTFCPNLAFIHKHEPPLIWSLWPSRCPILHISARWLTCGKWIVRVQLRCHIALPEDASARSSHLCCCFCEWTFPSCTKQALGRTYSMCWPRENIIRCGGLVDVWAVCDLGSCATHQLAERMWRLWIISLPSKGPS